MYLYFRNLRPLVLNYRTRVRDGLGEGKRCCFVSWAPQTRSVRISLHNNSDFDLDSCRYYKVFVTLDYRIATAAGFWKINIISIGFFLEHRASLVCDATVDRWFFESHPCPPSHGINSIKLPQNLHRGQTFDQAWNPDHWSVPQLTLWKALYLFLVHGWLWNRQ
jgi:hypothetical protein